MNIRILKSMLNKLPNGKWLKLEDLCLYGMMSLKASLNPKHIIDGLPLSWFCTYMGIEPTSKSEKVMGKRMRKLEALDLIKITRPIKKRGNTWLTSTYEVFFPNSNYELMDTSLYWRMDISPAAKGLAIALAACAFRGDNKVYYSTKEICNKLHISAPTYYKYLKELENAGIIKNKVLSTEYFPIVITNAVLKERVATMRMVSSERINKELDWFEKVFLPLKASKRVIELGKNILFQIETGTLNFVRERKRIKELVDIYI